MVCIRGVDSRQCPEYDAAHSGLLLSWGVMVEFVPLTVVVVVPTIVAFMYFLTRTYLGVWGKLMVFAIWFFSSIPLGAVIYGLAGLFYLGYVGYGTWGTQPRVAELAVAIPVSLIVNGYLALLAKWFDSKRRRRIEKDAA